MDIGLTLAAGATAVALAVLAARRHGVRGHRASRYAVAACGALALDLWLWDIAFDGVWGGLWGGHRVLIGPVTLVNMLLAFGAIHDLTGFGLHSEANIAQRASLFLDPDDHLRGLGYHDGERRG